VERLDRKYVPVGTERLSDGTLWPGDYPKVLKQFRGVQAAAAIAAQPWLAFAEKGQKGVEPVRIALVSGFESVMCNMFFLDRALYLGLHRSQIFFLGAVSDANARLIMDAVLSSWLMLRRVMGTLFPGAGRNWLLAWMMRSCHTVGHCIERFRDGYSPIDASSIESIQGELRQAELDSTGYQLNQLNSLVLLEQREMARRVRLETKGGYTGVKKDIAKSELRGRLGHQRWGADIWA